MGQKPDVIQFLKDQEDYRKHVYADRLWNSGDSIPNSLITQELSVLNPVEFRGQYT